MLNINLKPEYILKIGDIAITNTFLTSIIVTFLLVILSLVFYFQKENQKNVIVNSIRVLVFELLKLIDTVTLDRRFSKKILPIIASFFFFIITANLLALIPGFLGSLFVEVNGEQLSFLRSPNSDLTTTLALAIFSVLSIQFFSLQVLGIRGYLKRFLNFTNPLKLILGFFEFLSEGVKILSFSFRLFGNIFAGEVLLLVIAFLVPYILPLPFMLLEVFIGFIQAFIFSMLCLTFIKSSIIKHA